MVANIMVWSVCSRECASLSAV